MILCFLISNISTLAGRKKNCIVSLRDKLTKITDSIEKKKSVEEAEHPTTSEKPTYETKKVKV